MKTNPAETEFQNNLAQSYNGIGELHSDADEPAKAMAAYAESMKLFLGLVKANPAVTDFQRGLANIHLRIGTEHAQAGLYPGGARVVPEANTLWDAIVKANPSVISFQANLAQTYNNEAHVYQKLGRPLDALTVMERAGGHPRSTGDRQPESRQFSEHSGIVLSQHRRRAVRAEPDDRGSGVVFAGSGDPGGDREGEPGKPAVPQFPRGDAEQHGRDLHRASTLV